MSDPQPPVFSTKIPSTVVLAIGLLLFLMPFLEIRCNGMAFAKFSGVQLATGFKIEAPGTNETLTGRLQEVSGDKGKSHGANPYAIAAILLTAAALALAFTRSRGTVTAGMVTAILAAAALIALMVDIRSQAGMEAGSQDGVLISVDLTHWFYLSVIAAIVGAVFCWRRLRYLTKTNNGLRGEVNV
ncbi:MAG: hypothetical protein EOO09_01475 [Chitinophagaceae bacterium]|nr:MAG: hypothetical protein EOO09_01475 [Chitinophagaceae bacterium]